MEYPAPKLPPIPTFKKVSPPAPSAAPKGSEPGVKKKKATRAKPLSSVEGRKSRAKKAPGVLGRESSAPAAERRTGRQDDGTTGRKKGASKEQGAGSGKVKKGAKREPRDQSRGSSGSPAGGAPAATQPQSSALSYQSSAAQQPDLAMQVAEMQAQIAALRSQLSSVATAVASSPVTSYPPPATAAEQPPPPFAISYQSSAAAKPLPIYELKETRPVGYQSSDLLDSSSEESRDGFYIGLLDRARIQWLMGDWEGLGNMDPVEISRNPERRKLILLAGCGALQSGNIQNFKRLLSAAKAAKVLPDLRKALLSSTFSVLASAAQINGSIAKALRFERHAVTEMDKIGLLQGLRPPGRPQEALDDVSRKTLDSLEAMERKNKFAEMEIQKLRSQVDSLKAVEANPAPPPARPASQPDTALIQATAVSFYTKLNKTPLSQRIPFLLIDSKSLPRSGLHFLKNSLAHIFNENFSFCSWYQDAGCCKTMPCALTGFADYAQKTGNFRIRLIKSHDFKLSDPIFELGRYVQRVILIRHPLDILTSYFTLDQMNCYESILLKNGINLRKIWFLHEKEILRSAFDIIDQNYKVPTSDQLKRWLEEKEFYFRNFIAKWINPLMNAECDFTSVVNYSNILHYIDSLINKYDYFFKDCSKQQMQDKLTAITNEFKPRENAFQVQSKNIADFILQNRMLFATVAKRIESIPAFQWALSNQETSNFSE